MKRPRTRVAYLCCLALVLLGVSGILLSPSIGVHGGTEKREFTKNDVQEYSWGTAIASSQIEISFIQNQKGLIFMNCFLAGSLLSLFGGVHWYALLRRK